MALGFADKRRVQGSLTSPVGTPANYATITAMRTRLAAANPTYWTTARLNKTNENDMTYALRLLDDPTGVK